MILIDLLEGPVVICILQMAVAKVFKSWNIFLTTRPLVRLVDGDEAVPEVDKHPGGDHDRVHPRHPLHQHQRHPDTLFENRISWRFVVFSKWERGRTVWVKAQNGGFNQQSTKQ